MATRINHVAICTDYYAQNGKFYEALFGLHTSSKPRPARSVSLGDGYVGLNNIPRRDGRRSGLDHFGLEVDDLRETIARIKKFDPSLEAVERPSVRPFAAFSAHDPDVNIFDLAQGGGKLKDIYAEHDGALPPRRISHLGLRTRQTERCATFYAEVFDLTLTERGNGVFALSDGRVTLMILPWKMSDFIGHDPIPLGLEHIGFTVESVDAVRHDLDELLGVNPRMQTRALGRGEEGAARLQLLQTCPVGTFHLTDLTGVYLDVSEEAS